jgi:hypothetical protein
MSRILRKKSSLKTTFVAFRMTDAELKRVNDMAKRVGMSRSQFISRSVVDTMDRVEAKRRPKRTFIELCRYILGK